MPFGSAVDRGRQAGRAGPDHDEVADVVGGARLPEPDQARQVGIARVAQHVPSAPDHDRRLFGVDVQLTQERLGLVVGLEVDPAVRKAIAGAELAQPACVVGVPRADDREAGAEPDQHLAAQQERPQDQVAEHGVLGDELAQALDRDDQHLARLAHDRREQRGLVREQAQLAQEATGPVHRDQALVATVAGDHGDLSLQNDEEVVVLVPFAEQDLVLLGAPALAVRGEHSDLLVTEAWEGALQIGRLCEGGRFGGAHAESTRSRPAGRGHAGSTSP